MFGKNRPTDNGTELLICWNIENPVPLEWSAILLTVRQVTNAVDDDEYFVDVTSDDDDNLKSRIIAEEPRYRKSILLWFPCNVHSKIHTSIL